MHGLTVLCGITILWYADQMLWDIKVYRADGQQRFQQVSSGNIKGCLYLVDEIEHGKPFMLTEGEFDALIVSQVAKAIVSVASIGSAANKRINPRWFPKFISAPRILLRMDENNAGLSAIEQMRKLSQAVKCVQVS